MVKKRKIYLSKAGEICERKNKEIKKIEIKN